MKILVCGGRDYNNKEKVFEVLDKLAEKHSKLYSATENWLPSDIRIITGGAKGADDLAAAWAMVNFTDYKEYKADWNKYHKAAGPIRNQQMLDKENPDLVVAFPGGKGTADMIKRAEWEGIKVIKVTDD